MKSKNNSLAQKTIRKTANKSDFEDALRNVPSIYANLIDELHQLVSLLEFSSYQSPLKLVLKSFNPLFQWRFWRSTLVRNAFSNPDAFQQELPFSAHLLHMLETLTPGQLKALRQCNEINLRRLSKRILLNNLNKFLAVTTGALGFIVGLKQTFGIELLTLFPAFLQEMLMSLAWGAAIGFVGNSILGYLLLSPKLNLLRAFDDILSIAIAYANSHEGEGKSGAA